MSSGSENVHLLIDGVEWRGWKSCQVLRSIEAMAAAFSFGVADRWETGAPSVPFAPGMRCSVIADSDYLATGWLDTVQGSLSAGDHSTTISGRDASADLVDCSAVHSPGSWKNMGLLDLCSELAAPFGVPVTLEGAGGAPFSSFAIQPGESTAEAMQRLLKQRELLAVPDGKGGIRLAKIGQRIISTVLEQGRNVLSCSVTLDACKRFSRYIVSGQQKGTDAVFGKACSVRGEVTDAQVTRYRPLFIQASQQGAAGYMRQRAVWEKTTRRAEGLTVSVSVQGWRDDEGRLWEPGTMVQVHLPAFNLTQPLLLASVSFSKSASGTLADLELRDPAAFAQEPEDPTATTDASTYWSKAVKSAAKSGEKAKEEFLK